MHFDRYLVSIYDVPARQHCKDAAHGAMANGLVSRARHVHRQGRYGIERPAPVNASANMLPDGGAAMSMRPQSSGTAPAATGVAPRQHVS